MTQAEALQAYFERFGLPVYLTTNVPADAVLPYLAYSPVYGFWQDPVSITVNVWYHSASEAPAVLKIEEIVGEVKAHPLYRYDGGAILLSVDGGYGQPIPNDYHDEFAKGRTMNITAEYSRM